MLFFQISYLINACLVMRERTTRIPLELNLKVSNFFSKDTDSHEFDMVAERGNRKKKKAERDLDFL